MCVMVFRLIGPFFCGCVSVHPDRVLFSWPLPVQIQGCVPFPSCAGPNLCQSSIMSTSFWKSAVHDLICWHTGLYTAVDTMRRLWWCTWKLGTQCFAAVFWGDLRSCVHKHHLTPLRSETDKKRHFPTRWCHRLWKPCRTPASVCRLFEFFFFSTSGFFCCAPSFNTPPPTLWPDCPA